MREYLQEVSTRSNSIRNPQGVGHVVCLTKDSKEREKYIKNCILKGTVTVALLDGFFIENVPVIKHVWNDIIFPEDNSKLGSCVLWNNVPPQNHIVVVGVIISNDQVLNQMENQFSLIRQFKNNLVEVSGDGKLAKLNIIIDGGEDAGEFDITVSNKNKSAKMRLNVKGDMKLDVDGKTDFYVSKGLSIRNKQESLKKLFDDLIMRIENAVIITNSGPGNFGPSAVQDLELIKKRFNTLLNES